MEEPDSLTWPVLSMLGLQKGKSEQTNTLPHNVNGNNNNMSEIGTCSRNVCGDGGLGGHTVSTE